MSEVDPRPTTAERLPTTLPTNGHLRTLAEAATSAAERHIGTAFCESPHTCGGCHWWAGYLWALNEADSGVEAQLATARSGEEMANGCLAMIYELLVSELGAEAMKSTPAMFYPEAIATAIATARAEEREQMRDAIESLRKAMSMRPSTDGWPLPLSMSERVALHRLENMVKSPRSTPEPPHA